MRFFTNFLILLGLILIVIGILSFLKFLTVFPPNISNFLLLFGAGIISIRILPTLIKRKGKEEKLFCPNCKSEIGKESSFCKNCGRELYIKCPKCNIKYSLSTNYCEKCGYNLRK